MTWDDVALASGIGLVVTWAWMAGKRAIRMEQIPYNSMLKKSPGRGRVGKNKEGEARLDEVGMLC